METRFQSARGLEEDNKINHGAFSNRTDILVTKIVSKNASDRE